MLLMMCGVLGGISNSLALDHKRALHHTHTHKATNKHTHSWHIAVSHVDLKIRALLLEMDGYECKEPEPGKFTIAWRYVVYCVCVCVLGCEVEYWGTCVGFCSIHVQVNTCMYMHNAVAPTPPTTPSTLLNTFHIPTTTTTTTTATLKVPSSSVQQSTWNSCSLTGTQRFSNGKTAPPPLTTQGTSCGGGCE